MKSTYLQKFLDAKKFHRVDGEYTPLSDFIAAFHAWLTKTGHDTPEAWAAERITRELSFSSYPIGRGAGNRPVIGNLSAKFTRPRRYIQLDDGRVRLEQEQAA